VAKEIKLDADEELKRNCRPVQASIMEIWLRQVEQETARSREERRGWERLNGKRR
jgi:hypothetical protein